jgi:hypothetical protein
MRQKLAQCVPSRGVVLSRFLMLRKHLQSICSLGSPVVIDVSSAREAAHVQRATQAVVVKSLLQVLLLSNADASA